MKTALSNSAPAAIIEMKSYRHFRSRAAAVKHHKHDPEAIINECGERLLAHLDGVNIFPEHILDAPARLGVNALKLKSRYRQATVVELDASADLARMRRPRQFNRWFKKTPCINADTHQLPLADQSMELIVSNLCELFAPEPRVIMAEFFRVLKPHGLLTLSALGPDTLVELRHAWAAANGACDSIHPFLDMQQIGDAMVSVGFSEVVMDSDRLLLHYSSIEALLTELQSSGGGNARYDRCRGLTGKGVIENLQPNYPRQPQHNTFQATIELAYAHAWKPEQATHSVAVAPPSLIK